MKVGKRIVFVPDGVREEEAAGRVTHLAIAAHQDDIEFMAYAPICECFGRSDRWFGAVVTSDGAGSPRCGLYADFSDERMKDVRVREQEKAAYVGEYAVAYMLGYPSAEIKDPHETRIAEDYLEILRATRPEYVYMHNPADKHDTHVAVAVKTIEALRMLSVTERPKKVYGCEVWRGLDWVCDDEKVVLDCDARPNLSACLSSVFDSQITGGKRYDLAAEGRRIANATFMESHACDRHLAVNYAIDLTPLVEDDSLDVVEFVVGFVDRLKKDVTERISAFRRDSIAIE